MLHLVKDSARTLFPGVCPPGFQDLQFCVKIFLGRKMLEFMLHTNVSCCCKHTIEETHNKNKVKASLIDSVTSY